MSNSINDNSDFEYGCKFYETEFSQDELWNYLKNGNNLEKQLACLRLELPKNDKQVQILTDNLTGVDGKIREAVSAKLSSFLKDKAVQKLCLKPEFYPVFLDAIIDINGNICRNVIEALNNLVFDKDFCDFMVKEIFDKSFYLCEKIKSFDYKTRKYVMNKEIFKLYWYLAALAIFPNLPINQLVKISEALNEIDEYTVKEKFAVLVAKLPTDEQKYFQNFNFEGNIYISNALKR